jgi:hypothetical protein
LRRTDRVAAQRDGATALGLQGHLLCMATLLAEGLAGLPSSLLPLLV